MGRHLLFTSWSSCSRSPPCPCPWWEGAWRGYKLKYYYMTIDNLITNSGSQLCRYLPNVVHHLIWYGNWQVFCLLLQCHGQTSNNRIGGLRSKRRPTSVHAHFAARNHCLRAIIGPKSCAQICVKSLGKRHKGVAQPRVLFWKSHKGQKVTKAKGPKRPKSLVKQWNWEEVENTVFVINHRYQIIQIKVGPKGII